MVGNETSVDALEMIDSFFDDCVWGEVPGLNVRCFFGEQASGVLGWDDRGMCIGKGDPLSVDSRNRMG